MNDKRREDPNLEEGQEEKSGRIYAAVATEINIIAEMHNYSHIVPTLTYHTFTCTQQALSMALQRPQRMMKHTRHAEDASDRPPRSTKCIKNLPLSEPTQLQTSELKITAIMVRIFHADGIGQNEKFT